MGSVVAQIGNYSNQFLGSALFNDQSEVRRQNVAPDVAVEVILRRRGSVRFSPAVFFGVAVRPYQKSMILRTSSSEASISAAVIPKVWRRFNVLNDFRLAYSARKPIRTGVGLWSSCWIIWLRSMACAPLLVMALGLRDCK